MAETPGNGESATDDEAIREDDGSDHAPATFLARLNTARTGLYAAQRRRRERWAMTLLATAVGLLAASVHWSGLVVCGALVGLCWPTLRHALAAGVAVAGVVLAVAGVRLSLAGSLDASLATGSILWISVAMPVVACSLGAAVRGLFPDAPPEAGEP